MCTHALVRGCAAAWQVISRLLKANASVRTTFDQSKVAPLIQLLNAGSPAGQQQAACALAEVALVPANRKAIEDAQGIEALVGLLSSSVVGTSETAARVLGNLGGADNQAEGGGDPASAERRQHILRAGGIKQLAGMLSAVSLGSAVIARKMWELIAKVIGANPNEEKGGQQAEAQLLGVQEVAACAIADLTKSDAPMQRAIIDEGCLPMMLTLMKSGSQVAQEHAARAILHLCDLPENQAMVIEGGAIAELVLLSRQGSAAAQAMAAAIISTLAKDADDERRSGIVAAGGLPPLIGLVSTGNPMAKAQAASALWHLSVDQENRDAITKAGGIPTLAQLLDDGTAASHEIAIATLKRWAPRTARRGLCTV